MYIYFFIIRCSLYSQQALLMSVRVCLLFNSIHIIHSYASLDSKEAIIALRPLYKSHIYIYSIYFAFRSSVTECIEHRRETNPVRRIRQSRPAQYINHYFCISTQSLRPSFKQSYQSSTLFTSPQSSYKPKTTVRTVRRRVIKQNNNRNTCSTVLLCFRRALPPTGRHQLVITLNPSERKEFPQEFFGSLYCPTGGKTMRILMKTRYAKPCVCVESK